MLGWKGVSRNCLRMNPASISTGSHHIISYVIPCKTPPHPSKSYHALAIQLNLFLRCWFFTIHSVFSGLNRFGGPTLIYGTIFSLQDLISGYLQFSRTLLAEISASVADGSNIVMSLANCSRWIQTRSSLQFVALLIIGIPKSIVFQTSRH